MTNIDSIYCIICNLVVDYNILVLILTRIWGVIYVLSVMSSHSVGFDLLPVDICLTGAKGECYYCMNYRLGVEVKQARVTRQTPRNRCRFLCKHYLLLGSRCD